MSLSLVFKPAPGPGRASVGSIVARYDACWFPPTSTFDVSVPYLEELKSPILASSDLISEGELTLLSSIVSRTTPDGTGPPETALAVQTPGTRRCQPQQYGTTIEHAPAIPIDAIRETLCNRTIFLEMGHRVFLELRLSNATEVSHLQSTMWVCGQLVSFALGRG